MGMNYGITNNTGKMSVHEACRVIKIAKSVGIDLIDTAFSYGNSEEVIGCCLSSSGVNNNFKIITKTPINLRKYSSKEIPEIIRKSILQSCYRLKVNRIYGYLVHHVGDLLSPAKRIIRETLEDVKNCGLVEKIGFSAYEAHEIESVLEDGIMDIIQVPYNAVDHRLIRLGILQEMKRYSIEIHARSIFLQGVLLKPVENMASFFSPLVPAIQEIDKICFDLGVSRLAVLIAIVWQSNLIDRIIIGVDNSYQMEMLVKSFHEASKVSIDFDAIQEKLKVDDVKVLNPSLWPSDMGVLA